MWGPVERPPERKFPMQILMKREVISDIQTNKGRDVVIHLFVILAPSCWNTVSHSGVRILWNIHWKKKSLMQRKMSEGLEKCIFQ